MIPLLCSVLVGLPGWANDLDVRPKRVKAVDLRGDDAPESLLLMPPSKFSSVTLAGPGRVAFDLYGLEIKKRKRSLGPGTVTVKRGRTLVENVDLRGPTMPWSVAKRRRWGITAVHTVEVELEAGKNAFSFKPDRTARGGFFLRVRRLETEPEPIAEAPPEMPPPPEPPLAGPTEPAPRGELEPELIADVDAAAVEETERGFEIAEPKPPSQTVTSAAGDGFFLQLGAADGLNLVARGTGVLVFDFHAHRNPAKPETMEPAVLAVLLDDVLVDTLKVEAPASSEYSVAGSSYQLSERAQFQVTIPPGSHRVTVTLSDTALDGGSIRARFEATDVESLPEDEVVVPPEPPPIVEIRERPDEEPYDPTWIGLTLAGGPTLGNSTGQLGYAGTLDFFVMPSDFGRVIGLGLTSGFTAVGTQESIADPRTTSGSNVVLFSERAVPVLLDLRLALDFGDVALQAGVGGGGVFSWAETESLGSRVETEGDFVLAVGGHLTMMTRIGAGWLTMRGQLTMSEPEDVANLRDFDPGTLSVTLGYTFSSY